MFETLCKMLDADMFGSDSLSFLSKKCFLRTPLLECSLCRLCQLKSSRESLFESEDHSDSPLNTEPIGLLEVDKIKELGDCSNAQIVEIAERVIDENEKLKEHKQVFLSFLTTKKIDGSMMIKYQRKQFGKDIAEFAANKKLTGPSAKIFKAITTFDLTTVNRVC